MNELFPYHDDYRPVNIYKGNAKVAGWKWESKSGELLHFVNTYNDTVEISVDGKSIQGEGIPTPENPIKIESLNNFDIVSSVKKETVENIKKHPYDAKTETLYKTNILLPEPLRSFGDAKDRLFKDSDGLWKVERNVGFVLLNGLEKISLTISLVPERPYVKIDIPKLNVGNITNMKSSHLSKISNGFYNGDSNIIWAYSDSNQSNLRLRLNGDESEENIKRWLKEQYDLGKPLTLMYPYKEKILNVLPQDLQDKFNDIQSFKNECYIYSVLNQREELKPILHGKIKVKEQESP